MNLKISPSSPFESDYSLVYNEPLTPLKGKQLGPRSNKWNPPPYSENIAKQEALNSISLRDPGREDLLSRYNSQRKQKGQKLLAWNSKEPIRVTSSQYDLLKDPESLVDSYADLIEHHVATRVALFFQQAVICYKTPFHYEVGDTEGQIFEAQTLHVKTKTSKPLQIPYQAAHSSTIPSLKACPVQDYNKAVAKGKEPQYFSFLEDSEMETLDNSTVALPRCVNQVDTLIDGKPTQGNGLRFDTIGLINQLAMGKITPCKATKKFLGYFLKNLDERPITSKTLTPEKAKTIALYKKKAEEMVEAASEQDTRFFPDLLSVNVSHAKQTDLSKIKKLVFKRKYEIIREEQFAVAKIQKIINQQFSKCAKPADKHAVRACLTLQAKNDPILRKIFQTIFGISISGMETDKEHAKKLRSQYQGDKKRYNNTLRDIRQVVRNFQRMENSFQALLLRDFRAELRNLTQAEVAAQLDRLIRKEIKKEKRSAKPNHEQIAYLKRVATSKSTICRLENGRIHIEQGFKTPENQRRKKLTLFHATAIAQVLDVDPGYWFCSFPLSSPVA